MQYYISSLEDDASLYEPTLSCRKVAKKKWKETQTWLEWWVYVLLYFTSKIVIMLFFFM